MKIIKEENLNHNIFKDYDNLTNILEIFMYILALQYRVSGVEDTGSPDT